MATNDAEQRVRAGIIFHQRPPGDRVSYRIIVDALHTPRFSTNGSSRS